MKHRAKRRGRVIWPLLMLLSACGGEHAPAAGTEADAPLSPAAIRSTDTRGVPIAEYADLSGAQTAFVLVEAPFIAIGRADQDHLYDVNHHAVGFGRLSDGSWVLGTWGDTMVRRFDAEGTFLNALGRRGGAFGEVARLIGVCVLPGDSVIAFTADGIRFALFDPNGTALNAGHAPALLREVGGCLRDGSIIARTESDPTLDSGNAAVVRPAQLRLDNSVLRIVKTLEPQPPRVPLLMGVGPDARPMFAAPFAPVYSLTAAGSGLWVASGQSGEIFGYSSDMALTRVLKLAAPGDRMDGELRSSYAKQYVATQPANRQEAAAAALQRRDAFPEVVPPHGRILADIAGRLWVARYPRPGESSNIWYVFDEELDLLGSVHVPASLQVVAIGTDWLAAWRSTNQDGIVRRSVEVYRLKQTAAPRT